MRSAGQRWRAPVLAASGALVCGAVLTATTWDRYAPDRPVDLLVRAVAVAAVVAGASAWGRGRRVPLARLVLLMGAALFVRDLRELDVPLLPQVGLAFAYLWTALAAHVALGWPTGRVRRTPDRVLLALCYLAATGTQAMRVPDYPRGDTWARAGSAAAAVLTVAVLVAVVVRWWSRPSHESRGDLVVLCFALVGAVAVAVALVNVRGWDSPQLDALPVVAALCVVPVAGLAYVRLRRQLAEVQASRRESLLALGEVERSRRRIVEATFAERRRIQRDLHDGAQAGLAVAALRLWEVEHALGGPGVPPDVAAARDRLGQAQAQLAEAVTRLRQLVQAIYPAVLRDHGLLVALEEVADTLPVPLLLDVPDRRWDAELERCVYFCALEAVTNAVRHAAASRIEVGVAEHAAGGLVLTVQDDGRGGARAPATGGLRMLADRVDTFGGELREFRSEPGKGTCLVVHLPAAPSTPVEP
jgi:signal transduction histidine kinase